MKMFENIKKEIEKNKDFIKDYRFVERIMSSNYWRKHYIKFPDRMIRKLDNLNRNVIYTRDFKKGFKEFKKNFLEQVEKSNNYYFELIRKNLKKEIEILKQEPLSKLLKVKEYKGTICYLDYENVLVVKNFRFSFRTFSISGENLYKSKLSLFEIIQIRKYIEEDLKKMLNIIFEYDKIEKKIDNFINKEEKRLKLIRKI